MILNCTRLFKTSWSNAKNAFLASTFKYLTQLLTEQTQKSIEL